MVHKDKYFVNVMINYSNTIDFLFGRVYMRIN